jgi:hypothetical protein
MPKCPLGETASVDPPARPTSTFSSSRIVVSGISVISNGSDSIVPTTRKTPPMGSSSDAGMRRPST